MIIIAKCTKVERATTLASSGSCKEPQQSNSSLNTKGIITQHCKFKKTIKLIENVQKFRKTYNLLEWCDEKVTFLKENKIKFKNGYPVLNEGMIYKGCPQFITPTKYAYDIPKNERKYGLLCNFVQDGYLFNEINSVDRRIKKFKEFGGIVGFDLSPSVYMLPIRQKFSLLINCIYNCYVGLKGVKILPNARTGDIGTLSVLSHFPNDANFIIGELGCRRRGLKPYGLYLLKQILKVKNPKVLFIYGSFSPREAKTVLLNRYCKIIVFPDRNARVRHKARPYTFIFRQQQLQRVAYNTDEIGGDAYGS